MTIECARNESRHQIDLRLEGVVEGHHVASMMDSLIIDATCSYAWLVEIRNDLESFNASALSVLLTHTPAFATTYNQSRLIAIVAEDPLVHRQVCALATAVCANSVVEVFQTKADAEQWLAVAS